LFGYAPPARPTMGRSPCHKWPQPLAAAVVAFDTRDRGGQRMLDGTMLNAALLLKLATSVLRPVLTDRFAPRMLDQARMPEKVA
jgi:hypothetical protein